MPAAIPLTPETYSRLWATLWITLVDEEGGRVRVRRAVALRPEFTRDQHGVLRAQALRPFRCAAADRALDRIRDSGTSLLDQARVRTKCAAVSDYGSRNPRPLDRVWRPITQHFEEDITMANDPETPIVITDGTWMHIRQIRACHRRYPEVRGEGRTRTEALDHLANQLIRALDFAARPRGT